MDEPIPGALDSRRRRWLLLGSAGLAAAGVGAWLALHRRGAATDDGMALWPLSFDAPDGGILRAADWRGRPLVLNFWATWCAPCVREFPQLERFHREFGPKGWQVVGLAIDGPTPVRQFLRQHPVGFPVGLAGLDGTELARALGNERGGLPFTAIFDAEGRIVQRKLGETSFDELARMARGAV